MNPMRSQKENTGTAPVTVKKALVLISQGGYKRIGKMIEDSFAENNCELVFDYFNGECSTNEINRLLKVVTINCNFSFLFICLIAYSRLIASSFTF